MRKRKRDLQIRKEGEGENSENYSNFHESLSLTRGFPPLLIPDRFMAHLKLNAKQARETARSWQPFQRASFPNLVIARFHISVPLIPTRKRDGLEQSVKEKRNRDTFAMAL